MEKGLLGNVLGAMRGRTKQIDAAVDAAVNPMPKAKAPVVPKKKAKTIATVKPKTSSERAKINANNKRISDNITARANKAKAERAAFMLADAARYKKRSVK